MPRAVVVTLLVLIAAGVAWAALGPQDAPSPQDAAPLPAKKAAGGTVLWAVGDAADGSDRSHAVARRVIADRPRAIIYLGDVYETGTREEFETKMRPPYRSVLDRMLPTPGNHEWANHRTGYDPFWKSVTGKPTKHWYDRRIAGWQLISLNSEEAHGPDSPQVRWARERASGGGTCRIGFWHRPRHSAGHHGDHPDMQPFWDVMKGRAVLVLSGHDHDMQRFEPRDGIVEIVSGAGGRELYEQREDERLAFGNDTEFGGLRITLRGTLAELEFVTADGRVLDRSSVRCRRP